MDMAITKIKIISKEIIKPSSPTPNHLRIFQFSLLDQLAPLLYVPLVFFYTANGDSDDYHARAAKRSQLLKTSLSQTLSRFYPLAGRIKNSDSIECNDMGVEFTEARVHCSLSDILQNPTYEVVRPLLPVDFKSTETGKGCLLLVQATFFQFGEMALGLCFSHKLTDAATFSSFIKGWAAMAVDSSEQVIPEFVAASRFPPIDFSLPSVGLRISRKCITKRFLFDASKIAALRAKAASAAVQHPTRVEAVTALVWKCALTATRSNLGFPKPSVLIQSVNLRKRPIVPPLPQHCFGNLLHFFSARVEDRETELQDLVHQLREGIEDFNENNAKRLQGDASSSVILELIRESKNIMGSDDIEYYICASWCKFPLYEADFGWGKPLWVSRCDGHNHKNCIVLMDTRDGEGIEAWVTSSEEDLALLEVDQELLAFALLNPSPLSDGSR